MPYFAKLILAFLILFVPGISSIGFAQHENRSYLPIEKTYLNRSFVLKSLRHIKLDNVSTLRAKVGTSQAEINVEPHRNLRVTGKDKAGKAWTVLR